MRFSQQILVIICSQSTSDRDEYNNVLSALEYSRISYSLFDLAETSSVSPDLDQFSCIILASSRVDFLSDILSQNIIEFVSNGGGLVVSVPLWDYRFALLFNLTSCLGCPPNSQIDTSSTTLNFISDIFPGIKGLSVALPFVEKNLAFTSFIDEEYQTIVESEDGKPVAWIRRYGEGRAIYWNTSFLCTRLGIGLVVQSIQLCQRVSVLPIANVGVVQVDDFPAGFANLSAEPILTEYKLKFVDFLQNVWLPDILCLAKEFKIPLTFFTLFNYNNDKCAPFLFTEWDELKIAEGEELMSLSSFNCRKLSKYFELGFHGYNHVPLKGSIWENEGNIISAIGAAMLKWESDKLGPLPRCYVPPMNEFDQEGLQALVKAAPSITTICGDFLGDFNKGQARDFGPEPLCPSLFALPRLTYGYELDSLNRFFMFTTLASLGVWTHFFHPDDVIDTPSNFPNREEYRNPNEKMWQRDSATGLSYLSNLRNWFQYASSTYPWIRYLKTSEARSVIESHLVSQPEIQFCNGNITVTSDAPLDFHLRLNMELKSNLIFRPDVEVLHCYNGSGYKIFTIRKQAGSVEILCCNAGSEEASFPNPQVSNPQQSQINRSICFIADVENWAFDNIIKGISKYLQPYCEIGILYRGNFASDADLFKELFFGKKEYDVVHFFWHPIFSSIFNPDVCYECMSSLDESERTYYVNKVARICKTTSVYSHQFLGEKEFDRMQLISLSMADGYFVSSKRLCNDYVQKDFIPRPMSIISDGVNLDFFMPTKLERLLDTNRVLKIGWAGNSEWGATELDHKGLRTIIEPLVQKLAKDGLKVVGQYCDSKISRLSREHMPDYYNSVDIYVCSSLNEGTPNPVLEAMACGIPILSTDVGIVRDVFGPLQQEFIVKDRTSPEFEKKLRRLVTDPFLRKQLSQENLKYIKACSWEQKSQEWISFFTSALELKKDNKATINQITALYKAYDAGMQIYRARTNPLPLSQKGIKKQILKFFASKIALFYAGQISFSMLAQHLSDVLSFLSLCFKDQRYIEKWCVDRHLPSCYSKFDWWRYLNDNPDLEMAGIQTSLEGARHWWKNGMYENRYLWPHPLVKQHRWLKGNRLRQKFNHFREGRPTFSIISLGLSSEGLNEDQLSPITKQLHRSYEYLSIDSDGRASRFINGRWSDIGTVCSDTLDGCSLEQRRAYLSNTLITHATGEWIVFLKEDQQLARPDSLTTMLQDVKNDTTMIVWKYGSSIGAIPGDFKTFEIPIAEGSHAGFAVRRRAKNILYWDDYAGAEARLLRRLIHSLHPIWIDDVLTCSIEKLDKGLVVNNNSESAPFSDGKDYRPSLPADLIISMWRTSTDRDEQHKSFYRERLYSFFSLKESLERAELISLLNSQESGQVLVIAPEVKIAPSFLKRYSRRLVNENNGRRHLCFRSNKDISARPLAFLTEIDCLKELREQRLVHSFASLYESLTSSGKEFENIDTELFRSDA